MSLTAFWTDQEDRVPGGDRLELVQGSGGIHGDVSASPGCELKVAPKNRTAELRIDLLESYLLRPAVSKHGVTPGGANIGDPVHVLPEH
jgi:hypothetical protein